MRIESNRIKIYQIPLWDISYIQRMPNYDINAFL